jgi:hypothetical protein
LVVEPIGYPDSAMICGAPGCEKPAVIWLTAWEAAEFKNGRRIFSMSGRAPKVRVGDTIRPVPAKRPSPSRMDTGDAFGPAKNPHRLIRAG